MVTQLKMVHADIDTLIAPPPFFTSRGWQHGSGMVDTGRFFAGMPFQRGFGNVDIQSGRGISNVLRSAWRFLVPVLKNLGREVGTEALAAGGRILSSLSTDRSDVKGTMKTHVKAGAKKLLRKSGEQLQQLGSGRRKRHALGGGVEKKKSRKDMFGYY